MSSTNVPKYSISIDSLLGGGRRFGANATRTNATTGVVKSVTATTPSSPATVPPPSRHSPAPSAPGEIAVEYAMFAGPFLEQGASGTRRPKPALQSDLPLAVQVDRRMPLLPPSLREWVQNYLDRLKHGDDSIARVWLRTFMSVPTEAVAPKNVTREEAAQRLNVALCGQADAKDVILDELMFWQITGNERFKICLQGPPGVGKTRLLKTIGEVFGRPIITINMDSVGDDTGLLGHEPSYQGINTGAMLNALVQAGCTNPIIFIDEMDKVKRDAAGRRLFDLFNQWLDDERAYFDSAYLGMRIDLSKVAFVVAVNDLEPLKDYPSLFDRLQPVIALDGYNRGAQATIFAASILPEINGALGDKAHVKFTEAATQALLAAYAPNEGDYSGVRSLKQWAMFIVKQAVARGESTVTVDRVNAALAVIQRRGEKCKSHA